MLVVTYKKKGIRLSHVCFVTQEDVNNNSFRSIKSDIVYLYGLPVYPRRCQFLRNQNTIIKDLSGDETLLFASLGKHLRSHIKKSYVTDGLETRIIRSSDIQKDYRVLDICKELFEGMYRAKGIITYFNMDLAKALVASDLLLIGIAYYEKQPIGFSAVLFKDNDARLWLTAFSFREDKEKAQIYSDAHKRLDWELLLKCKDLGAIRFDFGGVNSFEEPNGIAKFKMEFEKNNKTTYSNYITANSFLGRLVVLAMRITKKTQ